MKTRIQSAADTLRPSHILSQPMMRDKISLSMLITGLVVTAITFIGLIWRVHPTDHEVPLRYSSLGGFDPHGQWYSVYRIPAYALAVSIINGGLAMKAFRRNRLVSFYLLLSTIIIAVLCLIISMAFAAIV